MMSSNDSKPKNFNWDLYEYLKDLRQYYSFWSLDGFATRVLILSMISVKTEFWDLETLLIKLTAQIKKRTQDLRQTFSS